MTFSVNGALFKQSEADWQKRMGDKFQAGKGYPEFDGVLNVPADQAYAFAQYLMAATPQGDRQEIPVRVSGWAKTAASGVKYLSLVVKPDYKLQKEIEAAAAAQPAAAPPVDADLF